MVWLHQHLKRAFSHSFIPHIYYELLAYYLPTTVPDPEETSANTTKPPPGADILRGGHVVSSKPMRRVVTGSPKQS